MAGMDKQKLESYYSRHRSERKKQSSDYQKANREKCNLYKKEWAKRNISRVKAARRKWLKKNPNYQLNWVLNKRRNDAGFRILCALRRRLYDAKLRKSWSKNSTQLLGCSLEDFRIYLESKFEPEMSWNNYGDWHIDHIVPCALFDLTREDHRKRCFHFSNLQPMFAIENQKKAAKSDGQLRIL